ncbi:MAG: HAMP domain-containing sensor histidine kinase [Motiliproteus sp.]
MKLTNNLSLRFKIPLFTAILILIVGASVTSSLLISGYTIFKKDLLLTSQNMGRIMAHTLTPALLHDDVWKAYEIINTPFSIESEENSLQASAVLVLNDQQQVYVSSNPSQYPMLTDPSEHDPEISKLIERINNIEKQPHFYDERNGFNSLYIVAPIQSDSTLLGTLIMVYPKEIFINRFSTFIRFAAITTLVIIALLLPIGMYWGRRAAKPLVELSKCMSNIGTSIPDDMDCQIVRYKSNDELGQLGRQFLLMVDQLKEKEALEQQVLIAERMAAIGRFTAGIAHEINNPLGGMLNATSTLKRHGSDDPLTAKTVSLLERGLIQIKDIVAALLVEASAETHPLTHQDIDDTLTLVQQEANKKQTLVEWNNLVTQKIPIASTLIRQILLNLLLNAIQATPIKGCVNCQIQIIHSLLIITIVNNGKQITEEQLQHLFEPSFSDKEDGNGFGLWVTYQIVEKLNGDIQVSSGELLTEFVITLPFSEAA